MHGRLYYSDRMSSQYSIEVVKEGNYGMADFIVNGNTYERQVGRIDDIFSTEMKDLVIMMHQVSHDGI